MPKLNQIIAIEKGVRSTATAEVTAGYHTLQKPAVLFGISRTYQPKDEEGEQYPPEAQHVQVTVDGTLKAAAAAYTRVFDIVATKDWANCVARADIKLGDKVIATGVPATYLLFLEKELEGLHTVVAKLPLLDPSEVWEYDTNAGCYKTAPVQTVKSKKVPRNHVKAEATDKHAAQVELYYEDVLVGHWKTVKFSGALPASRQKELLGRVEALQRAVKFAREEANSQEAAEIKIGESIFKHILV